MITLDRWLKAEEHPIGELSQYGSATLLINVPDLLRYYRLEHLSIDFQKLYEYFNTLFDYPNEMVLYMGALSTDYKNSVVFQEEQNILKDLRAIGFKVRTNDKFWKFGMKEPIVKGIDVNIAIDMVYKSHPKVSTLDTIILVCGEHDKFLKTKHLIKKSYEKKLILFSLKELFDIEQEKFFEFLSRTSKKSHPQTDDAPANSNLSHIQKDTSDIRRMIYPPTKTDKLRGKAQKLREPAPQMLRAMIFIDYNNLRNNINTSNTSVSEITIFKKILNRVKSSNTLFSTPRIYTGFPLFNSKSLESLKDKQLALKDNLPEFKLIYSSNEALYEGGMKEKDVDINIAIDIIHFCLEFSLEKIILISGDSDFIPVIRLLARLNIQVELLTFENDSLNPLLRKEKCIISNLEKTLK